MSQRLDDGHPGSMLAAPFVGLAPVAAADLGQEAYALLLMLQLLEIAGLAVLLCVVPPNPGLPKVAMRWAALSMPRCVAKPMVAPRSQPRSLSLVVRAPRLHGRVKRMRLLRAGRAA